MASVTWSPSHKPLKEPLIELSRVETIRSSTVYIADMDFIHRFSCGQNIVNGSSADSMIDYIIHVRSDLFNLFDMKAWLGEMEWITYCRISQIGHVKGESDTSRQSPMVIPTHPKWYHALQLDIMFTSVDTTDLYHLEKHTCHIVHTEELAIIDDQSANSPDPDGNLDGWLTLRNLSSPKILSGHLQSPSAFDAPTKGGLRVESLSKSMALEVWTALEFPSFW